MRDEFLSYDAVGLGGLVQKRELAPTELLELTIQRIERLNPRRERQDRRERRDSAG